MADPTVGALPAPGWYRDDDGYVRWWNGQRWDDRPPPPNPPASTGAPYANAYPPSRGTGYAAGFAPGYGAPYGAPGYGAAYGAPGYGAPGRSDGRTLAMLAHLGAFVGGFIVPLVIYLTAGKDDAFVRHHASESLNFQLTYLTVFLGGFVIGLVTLGIGFLVVFPLLLIVAVGHIVFAIMGAVKANQGEWWRYPVNIRFVKGAV